jgi:DNA invertase Pin-like site-specific DNA recombinase
MIKYVAYYQVSIKGQGQSGLGLEAQQASVLSYVKQNGIIAEFQDIESGKKDDRPELI